MSSTRIKERLRSALKARGGTLSLLSVFKEFDTDNSGQLSWEEFCGAFRSCGLAAAPQEIRSLFLECDKDGSNEISFDEFINSLRGPMTPRRREVISQIFEGIDR